MNKKVLLVAFLSGVGSLALAQQVSDSLSRQAHINWEENSNQISFSSETPPLIQTAGAPTAFYSFYWEFGDGHFSKEKNPTHIYESPGDYEVNLWVTNHYDNGKTPETRPQKVTVNTTTVDYKEQAFMDTGLQLQRNREPMPEQEFVTVLSYKNQKEYATSGTLYFFYNEKQFKNKNFEIIDIRSYHNETEIPYATFASTNAFTSTDIFYAQTDSPLIPVITTALDTTSKVHLKQSLEEAEEIFSDVKVLEFENIQPGEERNIFFTLKTTPEMIKDTSAIVTVRGIYVPEKGFENHQVKDMEMEIVNSYDPNRMSSNAWLMNYRLVRFKNFRFKTQFQNNGDGPARTIRLEIDIPEMFDLQTLQIEGMYPECPICPPEEVIYSCLDTSYVDRKAIFTFKNIYLPGTEQRNVQDKDSTKGFVKYNIQLAKDFHKKKTKSRTAIYFDNNEPIITNYAVTRFLPGLSIGAKAGYITAPKLDNYKEYMVGVTISPYKSYRHYLQAELMISAASWDELNSFKDQIDLSNGMTEIMEYEQLREYRNITTYLVPISYRYNLNNYIGLGIGPQLQLDFNNRVCTSTSGTFSIHLPDGTVVEDETQNSFDYTEEIKNLNNFKAGVFVDLTAGFARIGPSVGARYVFNFEKNHNQIHLYAIWKF